jgi:hypothetical protein
MKNEKILSISAGYDFSVALTFSKVFIFFILIKEFNKII